MLILLKTELFKGDLKVLLGKKCYTVYTVNEFLNYEKKRIKTNFFNNVIIRTTSTTIYTPNLIIS